MTEIEFRLRFTTDCLGCKTEEGVNMRLFPKVEVDGVTKVTFMQAWFNKACYNGYHALRSQPGGTDIDVRQIGKIRLAPIVEGELSVIEKAAKDRKTYRHEGFSAGTAVTFRAALPADLSIPSFAELLRATGEYIGMSPFGYRDGYGRFVVEHIKELSGSQHTTGRKLSKDKPSQRSVNGNRRRANLRSPEIQCAAREYEDTDG